MPPSDPLSDKPLEYGPVREAERSELRRSRILLREAMDPAEHLRRSLLIEAHLAEFLNSHRPRVLGFCWPFRAEFDCRPLAIRLFDAGIRLCVPRVIAPDKALTFPVWQPGSAMLVDQRGIHYPGSRETLRPDILLLPVNAFDSVGYRLGYGGGFFDRTLAEFDSEGQRPLALGIGFELARVATILPAAHDIPLDAVVTEDGIQRFSARARIP